MTRVPPSPVQGGKEYVTPEDINTLVEFNRRLMVRRGGHHFDVRRGELEAIFKQLDQFRSMTDRDARILSMAAWILYRIAESRPFYDGNKTSAWAMIDNFLNWNGYCLSMETAEQKKDMHKLLTGVQRHTKGFADVRVFINRSTITFRSR